MLSLGRCLLQQLFLLPGLSGLLAQMSGFAYGSVSDV